MGWWVHAYPTRTWGIWRMSAPVVRRWWRRGGGSACGAHGGLPACLRTTAIWVLSNVAACVVLAAFGAELGPACRLGRTPARRSMAVHSAPPSTDLSYMDVRCGAAWCRLAHQCLSRAAEAVIHLRAGAVPGATRCACWWQLAGCPHHALCPPPALLRQVGQWVLWSCTSKQSGS